MPTLDELKAAYPDMNEQQLVSRWNERHPGVALEGAAQPAADPSLMDRVKSFGKGAYDMATSPTALKIAGTTAGLALAPEATIPAMLLAGAGSGIGGATSRMLHGEGQTLGDTAMDTAEGALAPVMGPALKGLAGVGRYVGSAIPRSIRAFTMGGGLMTGHPGVLALEAATNPKLLPRVLDAAGNAIESGVGKVWGAARGAADAVGETVEPVVGRARAQVNKSLGLSKEVPYRGPSGVSSEFPAAAPKPAPKPSSFRSANDLLDNPEALQSMDRMGKETAATLEMGQFGDEAVNTARQVGNRYGGSKVEYFPGGKTPRSLDELQSTGHGPDAVRDVDAYLKRLGMSGKSAEPAAAASRPAADFVHPEDTTGGQFGFDSLPEIGEAELTRLQSLFKRVTGR